MNKYIVITILSLLFFVTTMMAQQFNQMVYDSAVEQKVLIDQCNREGLQSGDFGEFYDFEYETYVVNDSLIALLADRINDVDITVVFGSWCGDSQEQVPRFYKILDKAGYDDSHLMLIAVNRGKHIIHADISGLEIERVPTIIIYKEGKEIGRIIETPETTLEGDLWQIVR